MEMSQCCCFCHLWFWIQFYVNVRMVLLRVNGRIFLRYFRRICFRNSGANSGFHSRCRVCALKWKYAWLKFLETFRREIDIDACFQSFPTQCPHSPLSNLLWSLFDSAQGFATSLLSTRVSLKIAIFGESFSLWRNRRSESEGINPF